jgi:hypothetical protein
MRLALVVILSGCTVGTASYTCSRDWVFDTGTDTDVWVTTTMGCGDYAGSGEQIKNGDWTECEQAGVDAGALESTCTCTDWRTSLLCDPTGVND